jgi:CO/xanthine dehydrogenase FAD-binding subunit
MAIAYRPLSLTEALRIRSSGNTQVLAGGTDLMVKRGRFSPVVCPVLLISQLEELRQIVRCGDELRIGASCTLTGLLRSPLLPDYLREPLAQMASPAIRNVATIGGNLCNASPAGDALPMLYALDAMLYLQSEAGGEEVPVQDFILAPGRTRLHEAQLLTEIRIPLRRGWRCTYRKVGMRRANSLSKLSFYALSDRPAGCLRDIRIAFGAVAPTVVRSREAELEILSGISLPPEDQLRRALACYDKLLHPIDDARSSQVYRRAVSLRLLAQYLREEMSV